MEIQYPASP